MSRIVAKGETRGDVVLKEEYNADRMVLEGAPLRLFFAGGRAGPFTKRAKHQREYAARLEFDHVRHATRPAGARIRVQRREPGLRERPAVRRSRKVGDGVPPQPGPSADAGASSGRPDPNRQGLEAERNGTSPTLRGGLTSAVLLDFAHDLWPGCAYDRLTWRAPIPAWK
jgi:hypothetical protein